MSGRKKLTTDESLALVLAGLKGASPLLTFVGNTE
jgi:hypothetical protein